MWGVEENGESEESKVWGLSNCVSDCAVCLAGRTGGEGGNQGSGFDVFKGRALQTAKGRGGGGSWRCRSGAQHKLFVDSGP